ncbi:MAG: DUF89 family protein [Desulfobacteraceae bacterium]|nr:DUF89 family protein [Desulfobacteraceae bacterium]
MRMFNDCLPCIARGGLDAARLATNDEQLQLRIVKNVLKELCTFDLNSPPPLMAKFIAKTVKKITGVSDPYRDIKKKYNDFALELFPELEEKVKGASFEIAVRLAIAGNIIDFGTHNTVGKQKVIDTIQDSLTIDINGFVKPLHDAAKKAEKILWLADNAGEIVFDKLLLKKMDQDKIIYAVRGGPTQNDATIEDAEYVGLTKMVRVIDTGASIPGVLLDYCSDDFIKHYHQADLIISKGQGNFETLDHQDNRIFFLFKAKCPVVADYAGCKLNDIVIKNCYK